MNEQNVSTYASFVFIQLQLDMPREQYQMNINMFLQEIVGQSDTVNGSVLDGCPLGPISRLDTENQGWFSVLKTFQGLDIYAF